MTHELQVVRIFAELLSVEKTRMEGGGGGGELLSIKRFLTKMYFLETPV
jgi:hypothetical protein